MYGGRNALPYARKLRMRLNGPEQTDFGRKGSESKGKEPRSAAKVSKIFLSGKGVNRAKISKRWA